MISIETIQGELQITAVYDLTGIDWSDENAFLSRCAEASAWAARFKHIIESENVIPFPGTIRALMEGRPRVGD